jgi:hypothetical protein
MVAHLGEFAPKHCEIMGGEAVSALVHHGVSRAFEYGLTNRGPVRLYLDLMFLFGSAFDTDPQYPWASEALNSSAGQAERADRLHSETMTYIERVAGPDYQYAKESLRRSGGISLEVLRLPPGSDFDAATLRRFSQVYPEKVAYVGETPLRLLVQSAREISAAHSIQDTLGVSVLAGLMFALGHGLTADPQFPWVAATLKNQAIEEKGKRIERLFSKAHTYLERVLVYIGER